MRRGYDGSKCLGVCQHGAMALSIDTSEPLRTPRQLASLVRAVVNAEATDEKPNLEWKSILDIGKSGKQGHFSIARCILGMANRQVDNAATSFGGCGYLVVGAEPGGVTGVDIPDSESLEDWIERYTGDGGPRWSPHSVRIEDKTVLVVIVEPPKLGDPIFTLAKDFDSSKSGAIFVRRLGRTEHATPGDVRALSDRLLSGQEAVARLDGVNVAITDLACVQVLDLSDLGRDFAVDAAMARIPSLPPAGQGPFGGLGVEAISQAQRQRFSADKLQYRSAYKRAAKMVALRNALERLEQKFDLSVTNERDHPLHDVRIRVTLDDELRVFKDSNDVDAELPEVPELPLNPIYALQGAGSYSQLANLSRYVPSPRRDGVQVAKDGRSVLLSFESLHPGETRNSEWFAIIARVDGGEAEDFVDKRWDNSVIVTAGNRSGSWKGSVEMLSTGRVWSIDRLLA
jgi:hypothetical protein